MDDKKLNEEVIILKETVKILKECYEELKGDVKDIKDNLLKRPSWPVTIIITLLTSVCIGLIVNTFK